jgi:hypothetical protein
MTIADRAPNGNFSHPGTIRLFPIECRNASCKLLSLGSVCPGREKSVVFGRTAKGHEWPPDQVTFGATRSSGRPRARPKQSAMAPTPRALQIDAHP